MPDITTIIRNAAIADGSGAPSVTGDVALAGDTIYAVGRVDATAPTEIDAAGKTLAPGFIDIHTHYDPQICWDRLATPSLEHGVTTVVMGNCSLSLAPITGGAAGREAQRIIGMFKQIEDIQEPTFAEGVPWTWDSYPDYLDFIGDGLGINAAGLVGHSVLRMHVMGDESQKRAATDAEIDAMCGILQDAIAGGALGLSISYVDIDEFNKPVPSRFADMREKIALAKAMAESERGVVQTVPFFSNAMKQLENIEELGEISRASGVMCSLAPIVASPLSGNLWKQSLTKIEKVNSEGGRVYGQSMPRTFDFSIRLNETSFFLLGLPTLRKAMKVPMPDRIAAFADPAARPRFITEGRLFQMFFERAQVRSTAAPENKPYEGRMVKDIAQDLGKEIPEVILDIALADELQTEFHIAGMIHGDPEQVAEILDHEYCHIGASDAGAHISQFCGAGDTTYLLQHFVRDLGAMTVERAVHRLTYEVARDWNIADRGLIKDGYAADLVLFDPDTIARGEEIFVHDVPGGANRYVRHATGIDAVFVNGEVVVDHGEYTNARPGRVV